MNELTFYNVRTNQSNVHPLGLAFLLLMGFALLILPRHYATIPMLLVACLVAPAQRVVLFTLDFDFIRLMVLFGFVRVMWRGEYRTFRITAVDWALIAWAILGLITTTCLFGTFNAFVSRTGTVFDTFGLYFLFRLLVRDWNDVYTLVRGVCVAAVIVAIAFVAEAMTHRNLFAFLGGVPDITPERDGRLRCQGAFAHPILAGCFWAAIMPLMWARFVGSSKERILTAVGFASAALIIVLCASSTPAISAAVAVGASLLYVARRYVRYMAYAVLLALPALHLVMEKPVWHLICRVTVVDGSTGYHRYLLIDAAIKHIGEWWMYGSVKGTAHWGEHLFDVTNDYIVQALHGGVGLLGLFVLIFVLSFRTVGRTLRQPGMDREQSLMCWSFGVALLVHALNFMSVAYFGQINMLFYLNLAMLASFDPRARSAVAKTAKKVVRKRKPAGRKSVAPSRQPAPAMRAAHP